MIGFIKKIFEKSWKVCPLEHLNLCKPWHACVHISGIRAHVRHTCIWYAYVIRTYGRNTWILQAYVHMSDLRAFLQCSFLCASLCSSFLLPSFGLIEMSLKMNIKSPLSSTLHYQKMKTKLQKMFKSQTLLPKTVFEENQRLAYHRASFPNILIPEKQSYASTLLKSSRIQIFRTYD